MNLLSYDATQWVTFQKAPLSLLLFSARWCGTCRGVARSLLALPDEVVFQAMMIDVETEKALAATYEVFGVPVLILLKNGVEQARHSGSTIYSELIEWLRECGITILTVPEN